jgi:heterodisulfide reductase subunit B
VATKLVYNLLECAERAGATCLVTTCPLCTMNLEGYRGKVAHHYGKSFADLRVLAFTQLLAIAFGLPRAETGVDQGLIPAEPLLTPYL